MTSLHGVLTGKFFYIYIIQRSHSAVRTRCLEWYNWLLTPIELRRITLLSIVLISVNIY